MSRGATAEWPMRKDDTHNSRLLGSMIGPKLFCESVRPQLNCYRSGVSERRRARKLIDDGSARSVNSGESIVCHAAAEDSQSQTQSSSSASVAQEDASFARSAQ